MDRKFWLLNLLLISIWFSLNGPLIVHGQQQRVHLYISSGSREGQLVILRCRGSNLEEGNIIEWARVVNNTEVIIARNLTTLISGYTASLYDIFSTYRYEILTIANVTKHNTGRYICRVKNSRGDGSSTLASADYVLSVMYFPSAIYPVCSPDGPFTVQEGTKINMSCTTDIGNPHVHVSVVTCGSVYTWAISNTGINDEEKRSAEVTVGAGGSGNTARCQLISSAFQDKESFCTIGPITVLPATTTNPLASSVSPVTDQSFCHLCPSSATTPDPAKSSVTAIAVSATFLILFIVSVIINIALLRRRRLNDLPKKEDNKEVHVPKTDPYMDLQPENDKNRVYMDPKSQHVYYQDVVQRSKGDKKTRPEVRSSTEYEVVEIK